MSRAPWCLHGKRAQALLLLLLLLLRAECCESLRNNDRQQDDGFWNHLLPRPARLVSPDAGAHPQRGGEDGSQPVSQAVQHCLRLQCGRATAGGLGRTAQWVTQQGSWVQAALRVLMQVGQCAEYWIELDRVRRLRLRSFLLFMAFPKACPAKRNPSKQLLTWGDVKKGVEHWASLSLMARPTSASCRVGWQERDEEAGVNGTRHAVQHMTNCHKQVMQCFGSGRHDTALAPKRGTPVHHPTTATSCLHRDVECKGAPAAAGDNHVRQAHAVGQSEQQTPGWHGRTGGCVGQGGQVQVLARGVHRAAGKAGRELQF